MVRSNRTGFWMFLVGAVVMATAVVLDQDFATSLSLSCVAWIGVDGVYRLRNGLNGRNKWLGARGGGVIGFAPVWILGLLMLLLLQTGFLPV